jgi:hypothetical protein
MSSYDRFDGALLAQLEERGTVDAGEFVAYVRGFGDAEWPGPASDDDTLRWVREALERGLVRHDAEDDHAYVTITDDGRHRLRELLHIG